LLISAVGASPNLVRGHFRGLLRRRFDGAAIKDLDGVAERTCNLRINLLFGPERPRALASPASSTCPLRRNDTKAFSVDRAAIVTSKQRTQQDPSMP
jgi:hypothetical protein